MKRRKSTLPVGVWSAYCRPPTAGHDAIRAQLLQAWRYQSWLVGFELQRRREYRVARGSVGAELPALEVELSELSTRIEAARDELLQARKAKRKRVEYAEASAVIKVLREERKRLLVRVKEARADVEAIYAPADVERKRRADERAKDAGPRIRERVNAVVLEEMLSEDWPEPWKAVARIDAEHTAARKSARADCGLTPGTYLLVERAMDAAARERTDPERPRFHGDGRLGVQVHRLSVADLLAGANTQIQLKLSGGARAGRGRLYGTLRIRVTPDDVFAELPVKLWRPLPADAVITQAWILVRRSGPNTRYELQLTTETESWARSEPVHGSGVVAADLGWRVVAGGVRVAYWYDDHGRHGQIVVPEIVRTSFTYANELRGFADKHFDAARLVLASWVQANPHVPEWMPSAVEHMSQWRAHWKLERVAEQLAAHVPVGAWDSWRRQRQRERLDLFGTFSDVSAFIDGAHPPIVHIATYLDFWRRKDLHLWDWATRERGYAENRRRELFRKVAQIARQYEHVLIGRIDLSAFPQNAKPEETPDKEWLHGVQRIAAPGMLAALVTEACGKARVERVSEVNTTCECHRCGHINTKWAVPEELVQQCSSCHALWDQDENAARVMLARWYRERSGDDETLGGSRKSEEHVGSGAAQQAPSVAPAVPKRDRSQTSRQVSNPTEVL